MKDLNKGQCTGAFSDKKSTKLDISLSSSISTTSNIKHCARSDQNLHHFKRLISPEKTFHYASLFKKYAFWGFFLTIWCRIPPGFICLCSDPRSFLPNTSSSEKIIDWEESLALLYSSLMTNPGCSVVASTVSIQAKLSKIKKWWSRNTKWKFSTWRVQIFLTGPLRKYNKNWRERLFVSLLSATFFNLYKHKPIKGTCYDGSSTHHLTWGQMLPSR